MSKHKSMETTIDGKISVAWWIEPDDSAEDPRAGFDKEVLETFESAATFQAKAEQLFGDDVRNAVSNLVAGNCVWVADRAWFGVERYRHSGDVLALCTEGNFVDRQWDVSPIVGFASPEPDLLTPAERGTAEGEAKARVASRSSLKTMNLWLDGDSWGAKATIDKGDGSVPQEESLWGILGSDEAINYARELAAGLAAPHCSALPKELAAKPDPAAKKAAAKP